MSESFKIDKGIPAPAPSKRYPFSEMEIGDSFFLSGSVQSVRNLASLNGARNHRKFTVRRDGDGYRCWRIA